MLAVRPNPNQLQDFRALERQDTAGDQGLVIGNSRSVEFFTHHALPDLGFGKHWAELTIDGTTLGNLIWIARHTSLDLSGVHVVLIPDAALISLARDGTDPADLAHGYAQLITALEGKVAPDCRFLVGEVLPQDPSLPHGDHYDNVARMELDSRLVRLCDKLPEAHFVDFDPAMDDPTNTALYPDGDHFSDLALHDHLTPEIEAAWAAWG